MNDYDYIMTVDENGSPVLAHAWGQKGSTKDGHKWVARENIGGKWRYWYDTASYNIWKAGGRVKNAASGAVNKVGDKLGFDERKRLQNANILNRNKRQSEYDKTLLGRAENAANQVGNKARQAASGAKGIANKAAGGVKGMANKAADKLGFDERERLNDANFLNRNKRQQEYNATALGKAENAAKSGKKKIKDLSDAVKEHGSKSLNDIKGVAGRAASGAKNAAGNVKNKAAGVVDKAADKLGLDERERLNDANFLNRNRRQQEYDATPMGRAEKAANQVRDKASGVAEKAKGAVDTAKDKASDIRNSIRNLADSAGSKARDTAEKARNAVGEVSGANAKKEMDEQGRKAMMGLDDAIGNVIDAQASYNNSLGGRASSAASNLEASLKAAESKAKKALAKAMDYLPEDQIEAIKDLIRRK